MGSQKASTTILFKNQFTSLFQPAPQIPVVTTQKPLEEPTTTSSSSSGGFNLGSVFNFLNPLIQHKPDIILHDSPAIKTLPAPDLTKSGPQLAGGYVEGAENLYVDQIEAKRRREHRFNHQHHRQDHQQDHHHQPHHDHQTHQEHHPPHHQAHREHQPHHHVQHHQTTQNHQHHHQEQQQQQQKKQQDHIAQPSFVDVKFEHFVPGHVEDIEPPRRHRHPNLDRQPGNFSVLVSGLSKTPNPKELAKLFKEGVVAEKKHKAFITNNHVDAPEGFGKVTLPFLDPSEAAERRVDGLPSVFIAPVGYKVPAGYKGHPLPYDPSIVDRLTTEEVNLVHSTEETPSPSPNDIGDVRNPFLKPILTEPEQEVQSVVIEEPTIAGPFRPVLDRNHGQQQDADQDADVRSPTALVLNKIKLARNRSRAHLASLYKNQENKGPSGAIAPISTIVRDFNGRKRKRVLTKVVRKPYNPDTTTTPATQKVSEEDVRTVVRIVGAPGTTKDTTKHVHEVHEQVTATELEELEVSQLQNHIIPQLLNTLNLLPI